jgi:hypothetical protein
MTLTVGIVGWRRCARSQRSLAQTPLRTRCMLDSRSCLIAWRAMWRTTVPRALH